MDKSLKDFLDNNKITYEEFTHPAIFTVAEGKKLKENLPGLHCKCLFLYDEQKRYYLLGMQANARCDLKGLRKQLGVKKLQFGSEEKLWDYLKVKPGSVSIFAMIHAEDKVKLLLSKEVWDADKVGFHPNVNTATIVVDHANLVKCVEALSRTFEIVIV